MTAKEKATELVNKFAKVNSEAFIDENGLWDYNYPLTDDDAKQCALIAVDEIESALTEYGRTSDELQNMDSEWRYWGQVKTEIEKL